MCEFVFTCPTTGERVEVWTSDPTPTWDYFDAMECAACKRIHLVNPRTGLMAGGPGATEPGGDAEIFDPRQVSVRRPPVSCYDTSVAPEAPGDLRAEVMSELAKDRLLALRDEIEQQYKTADSPEREMQDCADAELQLQTAVIKLNRAEKQSRSNNAALVGRTSR